MRLFVALVFPDKFKFLFLLGIIKPGEFAVKKSKIEFSLLKMLSQMYNTSLASFIYCIMRADD